MRNRDQGICVAFLVACVICFAFLMFDRPSELALALAVLGGGVSGYGWWWYQDRH